MATTLDDDGRALLRAAGQVKALRKINPCLVESRFTCWSCGWLHSRANESAAVIIACAGCGSVNLSESVWGAIEQIAQARKKRAAALKAARRTAEVGSEAFASPVNFDGSGKLGLIELSRFDRKADMRIVDRLISGQWIYRERRTPDDAGGVCSASSVHTTEISSQLPEQQDGGNEA